MAPVVAEILRETARWWASRVRMDGEGHAHIDGVIGPDEYHWSESTTMRSRT